MTPKADGPAPLPPRDEAEHQTSEAIVAALRVLWKAGETREVRLLGVQTGRGRPHPASGYFRDAATAFAAVNDLEQERRVCSGTHLSVNPIRDDCHARAADRIADWPQNTTGDAEIVARQHLLVDVDPSRPSGVAATDAEKELALRLARQVYQGLEDVGWPNPLVLDSGNGVQLLFRVDLPVDDGGLCKRILEGLSARFWIEGASIDTSTHNPSRLCKMPGTWARKGDNTPDRPWRMAKVLSAPDKLEPVPEELLHHAAGWAPEHDLSSPRSLMSRSGSFDLAAWIRERGLRVTKEGAWRDGGYRWELEEWPLNPEHLRKAVIVQGADGRIGAMCQKASCPLTWQTLRERYEPGCYDRGDPAPDADERSTEPAEATSRHAPWPQPIGQEAFRGLAGEFVELVGPQSEADPVALLVQFLTALGSAIGPRPHFLAESDEHRPNLFTAMVGMTSKGRKGSSWGHVRRQLQMADPAWTEHCLAHGLSSGEGLIFHVRDEIRKKKKSKGPGPKAEQEEVVDEGVVDKRLLVHEGEFASVLRVLAREGNTLSAVMRNAWDHGNLRTLTKNSPAKATGAHISCIGHITKNELVRYLSQTEAANGFGNRFLWVCVKRSKLLPEGGSVPADELFMLGLRIKEALDFAKAVDAVSRDDEARELWIEVYPDLSEGRPGLLGAMIARAEAQVMRLAMIYALLDQSNVIWRVHLEAALAVWRYAEGSAKFIFGDALGDPVADEILRALRRDSGGLTRTDIRDLFGRHAKAAEIARALALLADHGLAVVTRQRTQGRPIERWRATATTTQDVTQAATKAMKATEVGGPAQDEHECDESDISPGEEGEKPEEEG